MAIPPLIKSSDIYISLLVCVCVVTDDAASVVGKNKTFVSLLRNDERSPPFIKHHLVIHTENIASHWKSVPGILKYLKMIVNVNFLVAKPLTTRLQQIHLDGLSAG